jgi:hypothetical protein
LRSGRFTKADQAAFERVVALSSGEDGGYRWGLKGDGGWVQDSAEALVTGYWVSTA